MARSHDNWIGGERVESDRRVPVFDPFRGEAIAEVALAGRREVERAIQAAFDAFAVTRDSPPRERERALHEVASGLAARREDLVRRIVAESGLPHGQAEREVERGREAFALAAAATGRSRTGAASADDPEGERVAFVRRVARGPVAVGGAFHSPLASIARKAAPALAAGATVVVRPPRRAPLTSLLLAEIVARAGHPHGSFNVVHAAPEAAAALATDPRVAVAFLDEPAGGGPTIVHRDGAWGRSAARVATGAFAAAGQAARRVQTVLVDEVVADEWIAAFVQRVDGLRMGDPGEPLTEVGPLIDDEAADRVEAWLSSAVARGARVLAGGGREGRFVRPAAVVDLAAGAVLREDPLHGPVVVLDRYHDFGEAIERASAAGAAQVGLFTHDVRRIDHAFRHIMAGALVVNDHPAFRAEGLPYGAPGSAREGIWRIVEAVSEEKVLLLDPRASRAERS
jgi:acyl-CoA reductase-like NAD-dependent aldehyde dehydrogenase